MNTGTQTDNQSTTPAEGFEDRLLTMILGDYETLTAAPAASDTATPRRKHRSLPSRLALAALGAMGTAAVAVAVLAAVGTSQSTGGAKRAAAPVKNTVIHKLALASAAAPALTGRYFVLSETDSETAQSGPSQRTSVIDSQTGASVTYQQVPTGSDIPGTLTEGPDQTNTESWYEALPTDPAALRAKLLTIAQHQQQLANQQAQQNIQKQLTSNPNLSKKVAEKLRTEPPQSDDELIYQEASLLLWSPLVQPELRSALYQVIQGTGAYGIDSTATDPSGRPAIAMTNTIVDGTTPDTDVIYEDPSTGAVLAQVWKTGSDTITAVYQPVTSSNTTPADPYSN